MPGVPIEILGTVAQHEKLKVAAGGVDRELRGVPGLLRHDAEELARRQAIEMEADLWNRVAAILAARLAHFGTVGIFVERRARKLGAARPAQIGEATGRRAGETPHRLSGVRIEAVHRARQAPHLLDDLAVP